jgi:F-type H+-transporting ATPase subunit gamma
MEIVSATKMRRAQTFALRARPCAVASLEILKNLLIRTPILPPLLQVREVRKSALLVVASDKGLAGAFNANILRKAESRARTGETVLITVGKKAKNYFERRNFSIAKSFWGFGDYSTMQDTLPVADTIMADFLAGSFDEVEAVYTNFRTTLRQEAILKKILPISEQSIQEAVTSILPEYGKYAVFTEAKHRPDNYHYEYKFEPSPEEILTALVPQLIRMHIHQLILESNASEHSARMVAMKSASDNAQELITDLTLVFNKARQAGITRELTEITAGREALEK